MLTELNNIYKDELFDVGKLDENYNNIFSSIKNQDIVSKYLHEQFTINAETYNGQYNNYYHSNALLLNAFSKIDFDKNNNLSILDIGSGSGLSVIPLLKMFENSKIICSDLSLELLKLLKQNVIDNGCKNNPIIMQLNAEELNFKSKTFDFVIGLAVLHHLFNPEKTLKCCYDILNFGGHAIFYEPFENGNSILCCIYDSILQDTRSNSLTNEVKELFKGIVKDMQCRKGRDKTGELFLQLDDKWLFTKKFFEEYSQLFGFKSLNIYSLRNGKNQFSCQIKDILKIAINKEPDILPDWAWNIIDKYDNMFSDDLMNDLLIEGCVILKK